MEFIVNQPDCHIAYLQVEIIREFPMTGRPAIEVDSHTKVGVGGADEFEVM